MRAQTVDTLFAPSFDKRDMGKKKIYIFVQDLFSFSLNSKDKKIFQKKCSLSYHTQTQIEQIVKQVSSSIYFLLAIQGGSMKRERVK